MRSKRGEMREKKAAVLLCSKLDKVGVKETYFELGDFVWHKFCAFNCE